jgi:hypothetical protein
MDRILPILRAVVCQLAGLVLAIIKSSGNQLDASLDIPMLTIHRRFLSIEKHRHRLLPAARYPLDKSVLWISSFIMIAGKNYIVNQRRKISQFRQEYLPF